MINDLFKPDKKEGELELLLEQAELLAQEADALQCNVTRDLEKLKASPFLLIHVLIEPSALVRGCFGADVLGFNPTPGCCTCPGSHVGKDGC